MKQNFLLFLAIISLGIVFVVVDKNNKPTPNPEPAPIHIDPIPDPAPLPVEKEPGSEVEWIEFKPIKEVPHHSDWGKVLTDIESHLAKEFGNQYMFADKNTHGHETTHGINSYIRNNMNNTGQRANGFYCLENRAAIVIEPDVRIQQVAPLIPHCLRGMRYHLYLVQQAHEWNSFPLYLYDEWVAYINGDKTDTTRYVEFPNEHRSKTDTGVGSLEFTYYSLGVCLAVKKYDSEYFKNNKQFREFTAFNIKRAITVFRESQAIPAYSWQTDLQKNFINNEECRELRDLAVEMFGKSFCDKFLFQ